MRGLTRRWIVHSSSDGVNLGEAASISTAGTVIDRVLRARGVADADAMARFCEPKLTDLHDPGLLPNIDVAVARIIDAVRNDEQIVIYGDYDVDGITASAILYHVIKSVAPAARLRTYVPHRLDEGYGINCEALRQLRSEGTNLVISVDCGITAVESARTARDIGLDLIITDHHSHGLSSPTNDAETNRESRSGGLPDCVAVVHPTLPGSRYPFSELCGAGVAFKVAWRFATAWCNSERVADPLRKTLIDMLPLAALGTIADVVPLVDENRIIAAFGLRMLRACPLPGVRAIIENANLAGEKIDSEKVGFILAPRLNACGRMGHAAEAVRMLTGAGVDESREIATRLAMQNAQRQRVERTIFDQAARLAEDRGMTSDEQRAIVLAHPEWHPGVVGIVCSRLVERFGRPTILMQQQPELCKGSARSIDGFSIHQALGAASAHLASWGGHAMAAGLTLEPARLEEFTRAFIEYANGRIAVDQLTPSLGIDCDASLGELDVQTVQRLQALAPFGRGNRAPVLRVRGAIVQEPPRQMGAHGRHLQIRFREGDATRMRAVWWRGAEHAAAIAPGMRMDLAIEPKINQWNGTRSVEADVRDVRVCD